MSRRCSTDICLLAILALFAVIAPAFAVHCHARQAIVITSDVLDVHRDGNVSVFSGNVVARSEGMIVNADRMEARYDESGTVSSLVAEGSVKVAKGLRVMTSAHAVYDVSAGRITLSGDPRSIDGSRVLMGKKIDFFPKTDTMNVVNSKLFIRQSGPDRDSGFSEKSGGTDE